MTAITGLDRATPTVHLKTDQLRAAARNRNWRTDADLARGLGLHPAQICRALSTDARQGPGERFIAAVLNAFPKATFEDFFEIGPSHAIPQRAHNLPGSGRRTRRAS